MKYSYTAYFFPDQKNRTCRVEIPALSEMFEVNPKPFSQRKIIREAEQELALILCIREKTDSDIPPESGYDHGLDGYEYSKYLTVDSETAASRIVSIRRIDLT